MYQQLIKDFIQQEKLPPSYLLDATQCFLPLVQALEADIRQNNDGPLLVGINGAQGTGKSTLAKLLSSLLSTRGYRVANLSLDDFYYSKERRRQLAEEIHPLLQSRGVPGTHDVELALRVFRQLAEAGPQQSVTLPGFDKSVDDCLPRAACSSVSGPLDAVIFEGWCVGVRAQEEADLGHPINELEAKEDPHGRWRGYVNEQLAGDYQTLFEKLHRLVLLQAPGFEQVFQWRCLQEDKLRARTDKDASGLMDAKAIERFIQHFERLTRHCLATLPSTADKVFLLDPEHRIHC
jgi:D-glycerate 3-kinase